MKCRNPILLLCFSVTVSTTVAFALLCFCFAELPGSPYEHFEGAHCYYGEGAPDLPSV